MKWVQSICVVLSILAGTFIGPGRATGAEARSDPNLVGWWKLDDAESTALDSSGRGNHGTLVGGPVWGEGRIRGGLTFNGTSNYVQCSGGTGLDVRSALTVTMWVRTADAANGERNAYLMKGEFTYGMRHRDSNEIEFYIYSLGHQYARVPVTSAFNGTWHHLAGTYDGTALRLYIDGEVQATTPWTGPINIDENYYVNFGRNSQGDSTAQWYYQGDLDEVRIYDRALSQEEIQKLLKPELASMPIPGDGAKDIWPDAIFSWTAGVTAVSHDVYLGTVFEDVSQASRANPRGVLVATAQADAVYVPAGLLALDQIYYWRVDETGAPPNAGPFKGDVWTFTVPFAFPIKGVTATASSSNKATTGPENTVNKSGLDAEDLHGVVTDTMWLSSTAGPSPAWIQYEFDKTYKLHEIWIWNYNASAEKILGYGIKDATIEYSPNGVDWQTLGDFQFEQGTAKGAYAHNTTVPVGGILAKAVRITAQSSWKGKAQVGLSEVRFLCIPIHATDPQPVSGQAVEDLDVVLTWHAGREAAAHEVHLGSDLNAVLAGSALVATVTENAYSTAGLDLHYATTYYWKIDEVNAASTTPRIEGDVWTFSTPEYETLEDFEDYDDECNRIFFAWKDGLGYSDTPDCGVSGYGGNGTSSIVGNADAPYAERTIVYSGLQSMPMEYNNAQGPLYSEALREWTSPQSWSRGGVDTLTVHLRGDPVGFMETSAGTIVMNGMGTDIYGTADEGRFVWKQLTGDGSIVARVDSLTNTNAWAKAGVMIRESLDPSSSWAYSLMSSTNGAHFQARVMALGESTSDTSMTLPAQQTALRVPAWVKLERKGSAFHAYYSVDGVTWTPNVWNPQTISMASTVYIGLAVTSHATGVVCAASFSNVATTGNVTGAWQSADLAVPQAVGNSPESFYVGIRDSAGQIRVVSHPDPLVITTGEWVQWDIPLSSFAGVNLRGVTGLLLGVGNRTAPKAGGAGMLYVDEILLRRLASP